MYQYEYVTSQVAAPYKRLVIKMIERAQELVRGRLTFQYHFVGSSRRNMITCDRTTNKGFDFDIDLEIGDDVYKRYDPKEIKQSLMNAFNLAAWGKEMKFSEDSTRVFTIKKLDASFARIEWSCDFAVVHRKKKNGQLRIEYIKNRKEQGSYVWEERSHEIKTEQKAQWLKDYGYWDEVREIYLRKKNENVNPTKKSRALYAEAIKEACDRHRD